ncbi:Tektin-3 [Eumeta japonica]|uniref:Tektin-3 n=1 Tax=Eumeta variegata TaxID=151549 RepID=A0A4C1V5R2_EUMVA|nr:Tektin-3 [Eumeta japonica]
MSKDTTTMCTQLQQWNPAKDTPSSPAGPPQLGYCFHTPKKHPWRPVMGYEEIEVTPINDPIGGLQIEIRCKEKRRTAEGSAMPETARTQKLLHGIVHIHAKFHGGQSNGSMATEPLRFPNLVTGFDRSPEHAGRAALYTRYTQYEWNQNSIKNYNESDSKRNFSERTRNDIMRTLRETDELSTQGQRDSGRRIGERITDTTFWRNESAIEMERLVNTCEKLNDMRRQLERAIAGIEGPLHIVQECLYHREKRQGMVGIPAFLKGRIFRVAVQGTTSNLYPILAGIPQKNCLFPCLYAIYANHLLMLRSELTNWEEDVFSRYTRTTGPATKHVTEPPPPWSRGGVEKLRLILGCLHRPRAEQDSSDCESGSLCQKRSNCLGPVRTINTEKFIRLLARRLLDRADNGLYPSLQRIISQGLPLFREVLLLPGPEQVHDTVEQSLLKEVTLLRSCQEKFRMMLEKVRQQASNCRAAQHELETDMRNKEYSLGIDTMCHQLNNFSKGLQFYAGIERYDPTVCDPERWSAANASTVQRSQNERARSNQILSDAENLINVSATEIWDQWSNTNSAFTRRIAETIEIKNKLQLHLHKVQQEIFDLEKSIELLNKAVEDKLQPMKVAHTRLQARTNRPSIEKCRDDAQNRLVKEVCDLREAIETLKKKLTTAEGTHQTLLGVRAGLEADLRNKTTTLFIDRDQCMGIRRGYPVTAAIKS